LEQLEGPHVVERLLPLLIGEFQTLRECAFQQALLASMARQGDARLAELLLQRLNPHPTSFFSSAYQLQVLKALGTLGARHVIERLAHLLVLDPSTCGGYERQFQESLVTTLRQLGDTRAELKEVEAALQRLKASTTHKISGWVSPNNIPLGQRWARRQPAQEQENALDMDDGGG
jgi:DNA-directed RNA polymerase specialized sigma54-like protein